MVCRECEREVQPSRFDSSRWMCFDCTRELENVIKKLLDQTAIYFEPYDREEPVPS